MAMDVQHPEVGDEARRTAFGCLTESAVGWVRSVAFSLRAAEAAGILWGCSVENVVGRVVERG